MPLPKGPVTKLPIPPKKNVEEEKMLPKVLPGKSVFCNNCGEKNPMGAKFCSSCDNKMNTLVMEETYDYEDEPEVESVKLPVSKPKTSEKSVAPAKKPAAQKSSSPSSKTAKVSEPVEQDDGWRIDAKTGKKYKVIPKIPKEVLAAGQNAQARYMREHKEEFSGIVGFGNLNAAADMFLAHMRVPPSEEELKKARAELAKSAGKAPDISKCDCPEGKHKKDCFDNPDNEYISVH